MSKMEVYCPNCQKMVFAVREGHIFYRCQRCNFRIKNTQRQMMELATGTFGYS
ncbi:MAG: hypothetical protein U9R75_06400 [Candidatus Thermoplasmatota archaeon]|nr:hypothetical protein [Candidatus Thermoplasmatota archaeon]